MIDTNPAATAASTFKMKALLAAKPRHGLLVGFSAILPLLLGLPILLLQARQELDAEAVLVHELVDKRVATIMDDAGAAVRSVAPMLDAPCASASFNLRLGVQAYPFVRSLILAKNGRIYCSSLDGSVDHDEEVDKYIDGRLRLMPGNTVTPGRAFLVYREVVRSGSVLAGIDGQHIFDALTLDAKEFTVQIGVGGSWLGATGVVNGAVVSSDKSVLTLVKSKTYPFTVAVAYDEGSVWRKLASDYWPSWILLTLLGTILGYASHRFAARRHSPTGELRRAVAADEFVPFYQPIVRGLSGDMTGAEILVRWVHPIEGIIPPNQFVPLAERSGLIAPMTYRLMERVQRDLLSHLNVLPERFYVSFNISAAHCANMELIARCRSFLSAFPTDAVVLALEITEREPIPATPVTDHLFKHLNDMGVRISLDDFGTGNSSLEYLQRFTVDSLKIDQSFVMKAEGESLSGHILDNIVDLATRLNLTLIAEGVETEVQRQYIQRLGIDFMQGYLFGRPTAFEDFIGCRPTGQTP